MLARCRALQLFLEVAVVDDQRLLDLFTDAGLPSPHSLLADLRDRFDVEGRGLKYEQFQSFLRVAALQHGERGSKEQATKALLATLTEGIGSASVSRGPRGRSPEIAAGDRVSRIDMGFSQAPSSVPMLIADALEGSVKATRAEGPRSAGSELQKATAESSAEWADLDVGLRRAFQKACSTGSGAEDSTEMQSYQFYKLILSSGALAAGPIRVAPKEADAIFTGVRGFKSGVDFEGFKECLALVAQKIFPDEDPVAAYFTVGKKYLVDKLRDE